MKPYKGRIKDWSIKFFPLYKETFPDTNGIVCRGVPMNHPDGCKSIRTSQVLRYSLADSTIETENSIYKLEGPGVCDETAREVLSVPVEGVDHIHFVYGHR